MSYSRIYHQSEHILSAFMKFIYNKSWMCFPLEFPNRKYSFWKTDFYEKLFTMPKNILPFQKLAYDSFSFLFEPKQRILI